MIAARRLALASVLAAGALLGLARPAAAHPTDEVLQQLYVTPGDGRVTVRLDITPGVLVSTAFAASLDTDGDGSLGAAELDAHAATVTGLLSVSADGLALAPQLVARTYPPLDLLAAGGGTITLVVAAPVAAGAGEIVVRDAYDPGRGTVQADVLVAADAPDAVAGVAHADDGRTVRVALAGAAAAAAPVAATTSHVPPMLAALERPLASPWALAALLGSCALLGALHALTPGHGKTMLAAYLVGERGTVRQALVLGTVVTVTHTSSVIALGVAVLVAGRWVVPGVVVPAVEVLAGLAVLALGLRLVRARRRGRAAGHDHSHEHDHPHEHDEHDHAHHHGGHGHDHGHAHDGPVRLGGVRGLVTMGVSGGVIPCPEALGVLLLAVGLHRTAMGLGMIVAFSTGLALVLVGLGVVLVRARPLVDRLGARRRPDAASWLPVASAVVVTVLGGVMAARGITALAAR